MSSYSCKDWGGVVWVCDVHVGFSEQDIVACITQCGYRKERRGV